jgi:hypothetical protein
MLLVVFGSTTRPDQALEVPCHFRLVAELMDALLKKKKKFGFFIE